MELTKGKGLWYYKWAEDYKAGPRVNRDRDRKLGAKYNITQSLRCDGNKRWGQGFVKQIKNEIYVLQRKGPFIMNGAEAFKWWDPKVHRHRGIRGG